MLFVISLAVNFVARGIVARTGPGARSARKLAPGVPPVGHLDPCDPTIDAAVEAIDAAETASPTARARREGAS